MNHQQKRLESNNAYDEVEGKDVLLLVLREEPREERGIEQRLRWLFERIRQQK